MGISICGLFDIICFIQFYITSLCSYFIFPNLQETSPSVVFIEVLQVSNNSNNSKDISLADRSDVKVEGTGSGFLWDNFGHIVGTFVFEI